MLRKTGTETSEQQAARLRRDAQKPIDQRALDPDQADRVLDELVRRSIDEHGA